MLHPSKCRTLTVISATETDVDRILEKLPSAELVFPAGGAFQMRLRTNNAVAWAAAAIADPSRQGLSGTCTLKLSKLEAVAWKSGAPEVPGSADSRGERKGSPITGIA